MISLSTATSRLEAPAVVALDLTQPFVIGQGRAFGLEAPVSTPLLPASSGLSASRVSFCAHASGTHTECAAHLRLRASLQDAGVVDALSRGLEACWVLRVVLARLGDTADTYSPSVPEPDPSEWVVSEAALETAWLEAQAAARERGSDAVEPRFIVLATDAPADFPEAEGSSDDDDLAYLTNEAVKWLRDKRGCLHLFVDRNSIDRRACGPGMPAHRGFFTDASGAVRPGATVTESIARLSKEKMKSGVYLMSLQLAPFFDQDATPSRVLLFELIAIAYVSATARSTGACPRARAAVGDDRAPPRRGGRPRSKNDRCPVGTLCGRMRRLGEPARVIPPQSFAGADENLASPPPSTSATSSLGTTTQLRKRPIPVAAAFGSPAVRHLPASRSAAPATPAPPPSATKESLKSIVGPKSSLVIPPFVPASQRKAPLSTTKPIKASSSLSSEVVILPPSPTSPISPKKRFDASEAPALAKFSLPPPPPSALHHSTPKAIAPQQAQLPKQQAPQLARPAPSPYSVGYPVTPNSTYDLLHLIGKGGSSHVFCGASRPSSASEKPQSHRLVAIKFASGSEHVASLESEIKLLRETLKDVPLVAQYIDSHTSVKEGYGSLVLEYGQCDLSAHLSDLRSHHALTPLAQRHLWECMVRAVHSIHARHVVHGDLKPANFVLVRGTLKLIDFGIAKGFGDDTVNITRESTTGTLNYISPEALCPSSGESRPCGSESSTPSGVIKLGVKSDVWSLGCILYGMTYGQPPFHDVPWIRKANAILSSEIHFAAVTKEGKTVEPALIEVMSACLRRDPNTRPDTLQLLNHKYLTLAHQASPSGGGAPHATPGAVTELIDTLVKRASELVPLRHVSRAFAERLVKSLWQLSHVSKAIDNVLAQTVVTTSKAGVIPLDKENIGHERSFGLIQQQQQQQQTLQR